MKGHIKLRIIQIYLHANTTGNRPIIEDIYDKLFSILEEALDHNYKIMIMGDFNLKYEDFSKEYRCKGRAHWKYNIFRHTLNASNFVVDFFNTDHHAVSVTMITQGLFEQTSHASLKQHLIKKRIFDYAKMTPEKWSNFSSYLETDALNIPAATAHIDNHLSSTEQKREILPRSISSLSNHIKSLNSLRKLLCPSKFSSNFDLLSNDSYHNNKNTWIYYHTRIKYILQEFNLPNNFIGPKRISFSNVSTIRSNIDDLRKILLAKYDSLYKSHDDDRIKKFVQTRCENYKDNQGLMLDSLLDRKKRSIVIDRLIVKENNTSRLITTPQEIKENVNEHFQKCPASISREKDIPPEWASFYQPLSDVDSNIYNDLMAPPSGFEWNAIISALPKDKAVSPSGISNEMYQHLGPNMKQIVLDFISACLNLSSISAEWLIAHVYPIPKPKIWECDLNNTRPITLLDTLRKALVRLLNNRLAKIFVDHKILKGSQYAGLPGSSTFEPLRIINKVIQDAKKNNHELWILS
ncbi:hypothetical protein C1645_825849 [Glomus cerebriforme]|uniref:Endonuclease/exonuclease/phosphatase n=1 Tax=Glomus cerebriforme TaxID=658196 RepID=A0A397T139_9GLOM|nr:hypothetical protein C1645_825849 [Glomus cerebriforme]